VATYKYKDGYYLLFPWANGGNLWDFWARQDPTGPKIQPNLLPWVAEQCVRLAKGLTKIHDAKVDNCSAAAPVNGQRDRGFHGDIKPENILCFKEDPDNDLGDLRISDFGLTNFHSDKSKSLIPHNRPHSPTYRAPEIDLGKPLSRKYDIWGLGCVFLEMIVWLILGQKGLGEFGDSRFDEQEQELSQVKQDNFFKIETGQEKARVKESVTKVTLSFL
jgi:serine/threonine protein kinase